MPPAWQRPGFIGRVRRFAEPRLLMTAAMAFFSIALTLNLTGVRLNDLRLSNLRPSAVRSFMERRLTMASTPIIRYYDHLRLVYEVEIPDAGVAPDYAGRRQRQSAAANGSRTPGESKQNPATRMEDRAWTLRSSRASRRLRDPLIIWKHPSRLRTGIRALRRLPSNQASHGRASNR